MNRFLKIVSIIILVIVTVLLFQAFKSDSAKIKEKAEELYRIQEQKEDEKEEKEALADLLQNATDNANTKEGTDNTNMTEDMSLMENVSHYPNGYVGEKVFLGNRYTSKYLFNFSGGGQGMDIYSDYIVSFRHGGLMLIHSLLNGELVLSPTYFDSQTALDDLNHCGSSNFLSKFYNAEDTFPLILISHNNEAKARICRVTLEGCTTLMYISYTGTKYTDLAQGNIFIINENTEEIYMVSRLNGIIMNNESTTPLRVTAFDGRGLDLTNYTNLELNDDDILWHMEFPAITLQSAVINDNKIYILGGQTEDMLGKRRIVVVDTARRKVSSIINFDGMSGTLEPEGISIYKGKLYITHQDTSNMKLSSIEF